MHDLTAYFNKSLEEDEKLFRLSEDEEANHLWTILKMAIVTGAPDSDGTEASFHSFWDDNIRKVLGATCTLSKFIRDSNEYSSSKAGFWRIASGHLRLQGRRELAWLQWKATQRRAV